MDDYSIRLPEFEGPLDLLLQMIERRELDISRLSLAAVADQYLEFITRPGNIELTALADYLVIAAKLILAKSRLLLPRAEGEEEGEVEDSADALARQLLLYKLFKQAAQTLREREHRNYRSFPRRVPPPRPSIKRPTRVNGLSFDALYSALRRTIESNPPLPTGTLIEPLRISIYHRIETIRDLTRRKTKVQFSWLLQDAKTRIEIIVIFLAVLESIKRKIILAQQDEIFGEIYLVQRVEGTRSVDLSGEEDEIAFSGA